MKEPFYHDYVFYVYHKLRRLSFCMFIMCFFYFPEYTQLEHDYALKVNPLDFVA